jgi:hypothetical protein
VTEIRSLSDLFGLEVNGLTLDQAVISYTGTTAVVTGRTTVLGVPNQPLSVTFSVAGEGLAAAVNVGFPDMTLRQMAQHNLLPASTYTEADLPDATFTGMQVTPDREARRPRQQR